MNQLLQPTAEAAPWEAIGSGRKQFRGMQMPEKKIAELQSSGESRNEIQKF